jgi:hypothetical protein
VFSVPKSIQATVTLLESLHVILEKTPRDDIRTEVLPMLYNAFESTTIQVQVRPAFSLVVSPSVLRSTIWENNLKVAPRKIKKEMGVTVMMDQGL